MRGSEFVRDSIDLLYYRLQKICLERGGSYIDSPEWLKSKKSTINPKNNDDNCSVLFNSCIKSNKLKVIQKEYRKLNLLLISIIGKE